MIPTTAHLATYTGPSLSPTPSTLSLARVPAHARSPDMTRDRSLVHDTRHRACKSRHDVLKSVPPTPRPLNSRSRLLLDHPWWSVPVHPAGPTGDSMSRALLQWSSWQACMQTGQMRGETLLPRRTCCFRQRRTGIGRALPISSQSRSVRDSANMPTTPPRSPLAHTRVATHRQYSLHTVSLYTLGEPRGSHDVKQ